MATTTYDSVKNPSLSHIAQKTWTDMVLATNDSVHLLVARIALGVVMFPHGAQKVFGWFGGFGFTATAGYFMRTGVPLAFAILAILAEFLGALGLLSGFLARVAAFGILCNMLIAILLVHLPNGFFMN